MAGLIPLVVQSDTQIEGVRNYIFPVDIYYISIYSTVIRRPKMEIRKVWAINKADNLSFYDTKDEAVRGARALAREDRKAIVGIYETFAGLTEEGYFEELWSDDIPEMTSAWGLVDGESIEDSELADIIENGRRMD